MAVGADCDAVRHGIGPALCEGYDMMDFEIEAVMFSV
jgi:hypothetical protein